jgi:acetyl esterase/lipase
VAERIAYGADPAQFGELTRPAAVRHRGVVVVVHGGFWRARYGLDFGRPLAADLAAAGFTAWNIEYRRVGAGGGWPATEEDVAAAIDHLAALDVDTSRVVAVGHSAGGHLAVWAAGRRDPRVSLAGAVAQAGVLDLATAARTGVGHTAVPDLLGGGPDDRPADYRAADPTALVPAPVPVLCVHARADDEVPYAQSAAYVAAARAAGGRAALWTVPGDHYTVVDPAHESWLIVREAQPALLAGELPARPAF